MSAAGNGRPDHPRRHARHRGKGKNGFGHGYWACKIMVNPGQPPMRIKDILPNFRCQTDATGKTHVEIPYQYASYLPRDMPRELRGVIRKVIHELIRTHGKSSRIFDERADGTEASTAGMTAGYLIPLESWDFAASQPVKNWAWIDDLHAAQTQPNPPQ